MEGHKVVLAINLPEGFSLQDTSEGIYDETTRSLNQEATALGDHLGSTSLATSDAGSLVMETRYCVASLWDKPCPLRSTSGVLRKSDCHIYS